MIAIYLEEMGGLAAAHEAEKAALATVAFQNAAGTEGAVGHAQKRQSMRELRRKSAALDPSKQSMGVALGVTSNAKKVDAEDARPVRRVMTKEKRKAVLSSSQDDMSTADWSKQSETGFKYKVSDKKVKSGDVEEIAKAVSTNFLLSHLNEQQQQEVFSSMEECVCAQGDAIIVAGQPGEWFYVVHSGTYDAYIDGALIHSYKLDEAEEGGRHGVSFGELALLYVHQARAASIICSSEGKLWRLHAKTFREIVMRSSTQQLLKTLRSVEVLRELTLSQLQRLYDALAEVKVAEGAYIIREGEPGRDFFVVMEGQAKVLKKGAMGAEEEVMALKQCAHPTSRAPNLTRTPRWQRLPDATPPLAAPSMRTPPHATPRADAWQVRLLWRARASQRCAACRVGQGRCADEAAADLEGPFRRGARLA